VELQTDLTFMNTRIQSIGSSPAEPTLLDAKVGLLRFWLLLFVVVCLFVCQAMNVT